VLQPAVEHRWIYFPKGEWFDVLTGMPASAGGWRKVPVTLESIPLFARAGAFVFRQPVLQHTGERAGKALRVFAYPASTTKEGADARSESSHYEDDGESPAYRTGAFLRRRFAMQRKGGRLTVEVGAPEGSYRPAARPLELHLRWDGALGGVTVNGTALREAAPAALEKESGVFARGDDGFVVVRIADRWERTTLALRP
jgi:alpha-glucosidase